MVLTRLIVAVLLLGSLLLTLRYVPFELPSYGFWAATILALAALVACIIPLPSLWMPTRVVAACVLGCSVAAAGSMLMWPASVHRSSGSTMLLESFVPSYEHREQHSKFVAASPERVWEAVKTVTAAEMPLAGTLMKLRMAAGVRFRSRAPSPAVPLLTAMTSPGGGFMLLEERPGEEIVLGMLGRPWASAVRTIPASEFSEYHEPGSVRIGFNFRVTPAPGGATLTSETRIVGVDPAGAATFSRYWRAVYPGSSIIRHAMLDAVTERAVRSR